SRPRPAAPAKPAVVEAEIVEAAVVAPPKVKEVVWSEGKDVPPPRGKGRKPSRAEEPEPEPEDDLPLPRRRKAKSRRPWLLIGMSVAVLVLVAFGAVYVFRHQSQAEEAQATQAKEQYAAGDYSAAQKSFRQLAADHPKSTRLPEYEFYAALAGLQLDARTATGTDPEPVLSRFRTFVQQNRESPFARPGAGAGGDIHDVGHRLGKEVVTHAEGRVAEFRKNRAEKADELAKAEKAVAAGRDLLPLLEPFRGDAAAPDDVRQGLDGVEGQVRRERARTAALASAAERLRTPSDELIQALQTDLAADDFLDDEARKLLEDAKAVLRAMVRYEAKDVPPVAAPPSASASVLFVTSVGATRRPPASAAADPAPPTTFLAVARGILYALDEGSGTPLWAVRVGADVVDPPAVARVDLAGGPTDVALVASHLGGSAALTAYELKTGKALWHQPLEVPDPADPGKTVAAPAAGAAVVVGGRAYLALRDREGTVYEFEVASGVRKGRIRLSQPAGPGLTVRPGTGLIYAAADARRVYVIDAGAKDDGGAPVPPRCVQILVTQHPPGSLRTPPLLLGPDADAPGERLLVLAQADGRLRAFTLPADAPPAADGGE
ncbi:MAG TPA: PQQ-binding-like beta-propeller repeat protein, partial [Gemmata sp.]|nr:PQQ-binding-like beta-propeller repeat protein [Gemmata sp.]